ncbi:hypothetical protein K2P97_01910 [bacterium]|nr:hypothetical protein [bacterium]
MRKNKYIVFAAIGFELISLILLALWLGNYLLTKGFGQAVQAFCVLGAFLIWFISLVIKLKKMKND